MISHRRINEYCCEDPRLIENYEEAVNDETQTWDCHHRLESDLGLSRDELKRQNRYFKVPANELIFLTQSDHMKLHNHGEKHPWYRRQHTEESKQKIRDNCPDRSGENNPMHGTHWPWMNNGIRECRPKTQEEIDRYLELGYHFGRK